LVKGNKIRPDTDLPHYAIYCDHFRPHIFIAIYEILRSRGWESDYYFSRLLWVLEN